MGYLFKNSQFRNDITDEPDFGSLHLPKLVILVAIPHYSDSIAEILEYV